MISINQFTDAERQALMEHQRRIADRDKDKRRRNVREYRRFLDYLEGAGKVTHEQRIKLEYFRMDKKHV